VAWQDGKVWQRAFTVGENILQSRKGAAVFQASMSLLRMAKRTRSLKLVKLILCMM
jgi:hypothetical protein